MRIVVHDYCGHPFQLELSRQLATHGHEVHHLYNAAFPGPKAAFHDVNRFGGRLRATGLNLGAISPTSLIRRRFNDVAYGHKVADVIANLKPDVVLSGNVPTEAQGIIQRACRKKGIRFVYWVMDIYSIAVRTLLSRKSKFLGTAVGRYYEHLDRQQLRASDAIVAISEDFTPVITGWTDCPEKVVVIENWGVLRDIPITPKENPWAVEHGLTGFNFIYSGTLGRKHSPHLLGALAEVLGQSGATVAVVAHGVGMSALRGSAAHPALKLLPIQPARVFPEVLGSADVLVATIEADAGKFAVPSKVQSYLCAGRPILLAAPPDNLAARLIKQANAGFVVHPNDQAGFLSAAQSLRNDLDLRRRFGENARAFAERAFDVEAITRKFERVLKNDTTKDSILHPIASETSFQEQTSC
jgi:colanic acid biosynthesis glycosyl transferase WcaI